jgi:eukaryotic-like serine/threonine-protein kinase
MESRVAQELGNYRLLSPLGQGGSADLYLGEQMYLRTQVAVKVLRARLDDEQISSFLSQVRTIARLEHPHIVRIIDCDIKNGKPFLVMQYVPGGNLRQRYPRGTQVPLANVLTLIKQAAAALDYTHHAGQIHGDVKPENMLLSEHDELLLSDFGLTFVTQQSSAQPTTERVGTIAYMAPEQLQGNLCPASDQYALGIVVYEWLCGEPPFHGTFAEMATQHALLAPESLRERRPDVPPVVEQVVLRALSKEPEQRFTTAQDFASALEQAVTESPIYSNVAAPGRRLLRRALLFAGLGSIAVVGGGIAWVAIANKTYPGYKLRSTRPAPATPTARPTVVDNALFTYRQHKGAIYCLTWSPDGTHIATGGQDATIRVWQAATSGARPIGTSLRIYPAINDPLSGIVMDSTKCIAWASDSTRLAFGSLDTIHVWNANTGMDLAVLSENYNPEIGNGLGTTVAWSPDGTRVASGGISSSVIPQVSILDMPTGKLSTSIPPNPPNSSGQISTSVPLSLAWSPNGVYMAVGMPEHIVDVWRLSDGSWFSSYTGHQGGVSAIAWSPDGKYMASACGVTLSNNITELTVHVWELATGQKLLVYTGHQSCVNALAWSPNGKYILSGSNDQTVHIWEAATGITTHVYRGHRALISAVGWSPDGTRIASASYDGTAMIWNV